MTIKEIGVRKEVKDLKDDIEFTYTAEVKKQAQYKVLMSQYLEGAQRTNKTKDELEEEVQNRLAITLLKSLGGNVLKKLNNLKDQTNDDEMVRNIDDIIKDLYGKEVI